MIERRDYLMAQIEAIGKLIAIMFRQVQHNELDEVEASFNQCLELLGYTRGSIYSQDPVELIRSINNPEMLNMLTEAMRIYLAVKQDEWLSRLHSAAIARSNESKNLFFSEFPKPLDSEENDDSILTKE